MNTLNWFVKKKANIVIMINTHAAPRVKFCCTQTETAVVCPKPQHANAVSTLHDKGRLFDRCHASRVRELLFSK